MNRISTHFLDLEGIKTAYYSTEGEGTPIVLLHGGGVDHAMLSWKTIMQTWTGSQPLVALDLPGYGNSDKPELEYSLSFYTGFLKAFLDTLNAQNVTLCGLSMGGAIALQYALRYPNYIGKLVLVAPWGVSASVPYSLMGRLLVRLPLNQVGSLNKIGKVLSRFEQENERRPSAEELAEELDIPVDKITDTLKVSGRHVSVDAPFVEGEDNSLLDVLVNEDTPNTDGTLMYESLSREIDRALATLTERESDIIKMFFGIGCQEVTLEEIGDKFGLTRERVRQIKEKAIRRLRQGTRSKLLKTYLG